MINPPPVAAKDTHIQEWVEGSVVSKAIADLNIVSLSDPKEIAKLLNWSHYYGSPGWAVRGIDLETGQYRRYGQFKPDIPIKFPNLEKPQRYLTFPKGDGTEVMLLIPDMETWQKIADKYQVPITEDDIDEGRLDKGFWRWVADNPQLPIEITEGAKKAGCLLAHGYISICVTGVWNSKEKKKLKAIASLAPFLVKGRPIHLVFDSDIVCKKQVQEALKHTGYLAVKQGAIVGVATWEYTEETKGVDDLIKNKGIEEFERIMDELQPFKEWLKSIAAKDKNDEVLLRLNSKKLIKYVRSKYRDRLKLNKIKQQIELDGVEIKVEFAYLYLAEEDNIDCSKNKGIDVFTKIAEENAYHPVINYLDTVSKEISPISLDNLGQRYFGTTNRRR